MKPDINDHVESSNTNDNIETLDKKIKKLFNVYSYEIIDNEKTKGYKAIIAGEKLDIILDSPEELINMLKLIDKIISIYKKEGYDDEFYSQLGMFGVHKRDLAIDNLFNTTFLSQEGLGKILNEKENKLLNTYIEKLAQFLNKIVKKL